MTENRIDKVNIDKDPTRIQKMFAEVAPRYDFLNHFLSFGIDLYWRRRTTSRLMTRLLSEKAKETKAMSEAAESESSNDPLAFAPLLDVASGTGDLAFALAKRLRKMKTSVSIPRDRNDNDCFYDGQGIQHKLFAQRVIGADFAPEMLAAARVKQARIGRTSEILFVQADGLALPFPDNTFAAVTIAFGIRNMSDPDLGLREMTRVCRPGGQVAVLEFTMPDFPGFAAIYRFYFRWILPFLGRLISANKMNAYQYLPSSVAAFGNAETMTNRFRSAGLQNIDVFPMTFKTATLYLGQKPK